MDKTPLLKILLLSMAEKLLAEGNDLSEEDVSMLNEYITDGTFSSNTKRIVENKTYASMNPKRREPLTF